MSATAPGVQQCCGYSGGTVSYPAFGAADYNGWTESWTQVNSPAWRQFTYRFRIANAATPAQIDSAAIMLSGGSSTNPIVTDFVYLCQVSTSATLTLGNLVWNDANKNGVRDTGAFSELGVAGVTVDLFRTTNDIAGDADDLWIGSTTTSPAGAYNFTGLANGKYVVRVTPPASLPATGGNVITSDNGINNDNNGSQPSGPGTAIYSPVITLAAGSESTNDGDTNPDTELSIDFGLFTGIQLGNQLFIDANNDGAYNSGSESGVGAGVVVELLDGVVDTVITSTTTNSVGAYSFTVFQPGSYRVRIPTPPVAWPLVSGVADGMDNGEDNDSNALQPNGYGTAVMSPVITLTAGGEPGSSGVGNAENTIDFGFRGCPVITLSPGTVGVATQYAAYTPLTLASAGGAGGYTYALSAGALPSGMSLSPAGVISGTPDAAAAPGSYSFTVRSTDNLGCSGTQSYELKLLNAVVTVNPATLPPATQYAAYAQNLTGTGGTAPYAWSVSPPALSGTAAWWPGEEGAAEVIVGNSGALMNGVSFDAGQVGRALSFDGVDDFMQVGDQSVLRPAQITLEVWVRPASATPPGDRVILAKTTNPAAPTDGYGLIQRSGGSTVRFWINRPSAVLLTSDFVDAPLTVGVWNHVVATYDGAVLKLFVNGAQVASKLFIIPINHSDKSLVFGGSSAGGTAWNGALDEIMIYNRALSAAEASARYASVISGNCGMPAGMMLDPAEGLLSGTPSSVPASYAFTVRASDAYGGTGLRNYSLVVQCPVCDITPKALADAVQYMPYTDVTLQADGGTAPYVWDIAGGALPVGMSLSSAGVLSGTPGSAPGTYSFTVRARDANNCVSTQALSVLVSCPVITLTPAALPDARQFDSYTAVLLDGSGGSAPYTFALTDGALPTGMSLSAAGLVSGTPTAPPGDYSFTVRATDSESCSGERSYTLHVTCPVITISPSALPSGRQYQAYSQSLNASGGNPAYTWSLVSGSLPAGLTLSAAGVVSGTPTVSPGVYTFRVQAVDNAGCVGTRDCTLSFDCPLISITPVTLPQASVTVAYSQQLTADGGTTPYTWSLAGGALPSGISFSSSGLISGTTSSVGSFNFTVQVSDLNGCVKQQSLALGVGCAAITITPSSLPGAVVGSAYSQQLSATGGVGVKTWSLAGGSLPVGMSLSASGLLSGTPTSAPGNYTFTVQAADENHCPGSIIYTLQVSCPAITISPSTPPDATVGLAYSTTLSASGATAPYTWSIPEGSVPPPGISLSPAGVLSGTPTVPGTYAFNIEAHDAYQCSGSATISMTVVCPTLALSPVSLTSGYRGVAYSQTLSASGGVQPYSYSLTAGSLPPGLVLSSAGVISGTPGAAGSYSFTVRGMDTAGCLGSRDYVLVIQGLSLGNLVWNDLDQNGMRDAGEPGIGGVLLQLFATADTVIGNADDVSQGTTTTDGSGSYAFTGLAPGKYYVTIATPPSAQPMSSGAQVALDNGVDNDNNGVQSGGKGTAVFSPIVTLAVGHEPGDVSGGTDVDDTLDFAFRAVPDSLTNLLEYTLNTSSGGLPASPSYKNAAVANAAKIQIEDDMNGLTDISEPATNGPMRSGSLSRRMRDWDAAYDSNYDLTRTNLVQSPDSLWIRFDMDPYADGNIGNILFDLFRVGTTSPVQGKVFLTWQDGSTYQTASTDSFSIPATGSWYSLNLSWNSFTGGATALPSGAQLAGKSFLVEIYLWGGDGTGYIDIDNIMLQGDATAVPPTLALGDFVWADTNGNGLKNPREPGLPGLTVQLLQPGADALANTSDDQLVSTTTTDANGYYLFTGLAEGDYFVRLPTPAALWPTASPAVNADNGVDNDSNGLQPGGSGTAVSSPLIHLAIDTEPGALASGGNQDMSVDFGFTAAMTLGNLIFADANNNGRVDTGEAGVPGAQVELFATADNSVGNGDDVKIGATATTGTDGLYSFTGLSAGKYYVRVTPPITHPRRSSTSSSADNGVDNDNNGIYQSSAGAAVYSPVITLSALTEPGNLLAPFGGNVDNTIDFGLRPTFCRIGNMAYKDANDNGVCDSGEGVGGVRVELLSNTGAFITSTTTSSSSSKIGQYLFSNVVPGQYYVRIPASEFVTGKALVNTVSIYPTTSGDNDTDDNIVGNDDGIDNAQPSVNGISSALITLTDSGEPANSSGESGMYNALDDSDDNNGNMTVDFGFKSSGPTATGCYHFLAADGNHDGTFAMSTEWTPVQAYDFSYTPGSAWMDGVEVVYDAALSRVKLDVSLSHTGAAQVGALWFLMSTGGNPATADHAIVYIDGVNRANPVVTIYRYDPTLGSMSWQNTANLLVSTAPGSLTAGDILQRQVTDTAGGVRFQCVVDVSRINNAANWSALGVDATTWEGIEVGGSGGLVLHTASLAAAPGYDGNGALTSFNLTSGTEGYFETDPSGVLTIATEPCSISPWVSLGNLVWNDANNNGLRDMGELGISGATVQLFNPGADNAIGGSGLDADTQVGGSVVTSNVGAYAFTSLVPGKYYVRVTPTLGVPTASGMAVTQDNDIDNDNNGTQPDGPGTYVYSPVVDLAVGGEPNSGVDGDGTNGNNTLDIGLFTGIAVGDLVWNDLNNNGLRDGWEWGIGGVLVELMSPGADGAVGGTGANADVLLQSTSTLSNGTYTFKVFTAGSYYVRLTPPASYSLVSDVAVTADNGVNNDNNGVQPGGAGSYVNSMVFQLMPGGEPGSTGATNTENTIDFGLRSCPVITLSPSTLADVAKGASYNVIFNAANGTTPYTWSLISGTLPTGMSLSSSGVLSGTPTGAPGSYHFTVRARDAAGCSATQALVLNVTCPALSLTPTSLTSVPQNTAVSQQFATTGGVAPYTYTRQSGTLPVGVSLSSNGLLSGMVTGAPGVYSFVIRSTDAVGCVVDQSFSWSITCPALNLSPATLPPAAQYASYSPQTLTATNGSSPYAWSYTGVLPAGMTLSSGGILSGVPTSAPGSYNITLTATDVNGCTQSAAYSVVVVCPAATINAPALPTATQGVSYPGQQLGVSGGTSPYSWSLASGALPAGLSLSATGLISGTPTATPGNYGFTVRTTDGVGCVSTSALQIVVACPAISIGPVPLPSATQYAAYTQTLSAGGGKTPYTWSLDSGVLPTGLTLSASGVLSGTPTSLGSTTFDAKVTDAQGCSTTQRYTFTVDYPPITITPSTLPSGTRLVPYSQQLAASGGTAPYTYSLLTGSLPSGITLSSSGLISGITLAAPGSYSFTVRALDKNGAPGTQPYTLVIVCPNLVITPLSLSNATVGASYSATLNAAGGGAPYTWSVTSGSLPPGLSLSASGILSGTPVQAMTASFTVEVRDSYNCVNTKLYTLGVNCPSISVTPMSLPDAYYSVAYSKQLAATGGTGPYSWSVIAGTPPAGMSLSSSGLLSGTPSAYGSASFTVRVTDAYNCTSTQSYSLRVKGLGLGNLVFEDNNFNGQRDNGEPGVVGVTVELWDPGADHAIGGSGPDSDLMIRDTTTDALGEYSFDNLQPGTFFLRVLMPAAQTILGGSPVNLDNGVDNDNNAATQPGGAGQPVYSPVVTLSTGGEPAAGDGDADTDDTIDFGLFRGMSVGNLVWQDSNDNGQRESGEPGIDGVRVELWSAGADGSIGGTDDELLKSSITAGGGSYAFTSLPPLQVYVRIPVPPAAQPLSSSVTDFHDDGVDDDDNGHQVNGGAVYSPVITLTAADEPGSGGGAYDETTIDFGFLGVTPSIYVSATQADSIQAFDATTGLYHGSLVDAFGSSLSQGNADYGDVPYAIELGQDGNWYVAHYGASNLRKISPAGLDLGPVLDNSAASLSLVAQFTIGPDGNFYVADVNGGRIVRFQGPSGTTPGAPIGTTAPYTFINVSGVEDMNFGPDGNLYVVVQTNDIREVRRYSTTTGALLNVIVTDTQLVNMVPGGEPIALISGIDIEGGILYGVNRSDGEIFSLSLANPNAPGQPQLIATIASAGKGEVDTRDIEFNPANNHLYIAGYNWGKPLNAGTYISGSLLDVDIAGAPNGTVAIREVPIPRPPGPNNEIWAGPRDVAVGRPFAPLPESVSIGSLVWNDVDADGMQDADELGIPGVRVELWRDANGISDDGAELRVGWTYTDTRGHYYFSGEAPGVYQVRIAESNFADGMPLATSGYSSPITSILDDQIDGDDSGRQPGGPKTLVYSPLITLTPGAEPLGDGITGGENGRGGELDNYTVDASGDMTIDFGFVEPGIMGIGNLVFVDANGNQRFDLGEGRDDVIVELYRWGDTPGVTPPVASTVTAGGGIFLFSNLWQGQYFLHLPAPQFDVTGELRGLFSIPVVTAGDDNVGQDALPSATPWITGVSTGLINLVRDQAPTDEDTETGFDSATDLNDININLTLDIGLFRPVSLGNLVFADNNSNGHFDSGEGLQGVRIELYSDTQYPGVDNPLAYTTSDAQGRYVFDFLLPGNYLAHVPASQFQSGGPLFQRISIPEGLVGDDDVGEDGINLGDPTINGVSSLVISLYPGNAPTDDSGETGFEGTSDNQDDAAVDLTIDFGFQTPVGVGNLVYIDTNENGAADVGEGVDGVTVELYRADQTPGSAVPLFTTVTSGGGGYFFNALPAGSYQLHIPYSQFEPGHPLYGLQSSVGAEGASSDVDDDLSGNENGIDNATPFLNGISSAVFTLAVDAEPTDANDETGFAASMDAFDDDNFNLTIDFGFAPFNPNAVGVGNLVFVDLNGNGTFDVGEGLAGVKVQLFPAAADPLTATPISTVITATGGSYLFSNLAEGDYQIFIPPSEFAVGKPLAGWHSLPGNGGDNGVDDNLDENGVDAVDPQSAGIGSGAFHLSPDSEPTDSLGEFGSNAYSDNAQDDNTDLTIDFGFFRSVAVGNLVFIDANYNGVADAGEGVSGVALELYREGTAAPFDAPEATTTTATDGSYIFQSLTPGRYYVRVPASQFQFGMPLFSMASVFGTQTGDDNLGEDGIDDGNPTGFGIQTAVFELSPTGAPSGGLEGGFQGATDDLDDSATNLTIDLGFVPRIAVGNVVFSDDNNDGIFDPSFEYGIDGVTVELWSEVPNATAPITTTTTSNGGLYNFDIAPGTYQVRVPASAFAAGAVLADLVPSKAGSAAPTSTEGDDDVGQDGYTPGSVLTDGVRTASFTLQPASEPTMENTETGYYSEDDDYDDANGDLTVDLGFAPKPLSVGNLVFRDLNENGRYDEGDFGVSGITVRLFHVGDDPVTSTPVAETTTAIDGTFLLNTFEEGQYFMHIPAAEFGSGTQLDGAVSSSGAGDDTGVDDESDENGLDTANPAISGVSSIVFDLAYGTEPVDGSGESGFLAAQDVLNDEDGDMTIDFGFSGGIVADMMGVGNLVFNDANHNGVADAGEGVPGVWMLLYAGAGTAGSTNSMRSTFTDASGRYYFPNLPPGTYTVHVAADNFKEAVSIGGGPVGPGPLFRMMSLRGNQSSNLDDNNPGEDGLDVQNPEQVGVSSVPVVLSLHGAPTGAQEGGFQGDSDDARDDMTDLTVDFGFGVRVGVGNLVFRDNNADGKFQSSADVGIAGINLELVYIDGVNGQESVIGSTTTDANGAYMLYSTPVLSPNQCKVRVSAGQFAVGAPLNFLTPSVVIATGDDDDLNQNAQPTANPETTGAVTNAFTLTPGTQPTDADGRESGVSKESDNADDADNDLTLDLGLKPKALMVGNLVFRDMNSNGTFDSGIDQPVPNVTVKLFQQGQAVTDTPVSQAVTAADGTYMLSTTVAGTYYVHIPAAMFAADAPLDGLLSVSGLGNLLQTGTSDLTKDDRLDENGSDDQQPAATGVVSGTLNLSYGGMPLNSTVTDPAGENGFNAFMDDVADSSGVMTIDFGFRSLLGPLAATERRTLTGTTSAHDTPATVFSAWQSQNGLSGLNGPNDDPDADGLPNLVEYALGTPADSSLGSSRFTLASHEEDGSIDALITRPAGEHADLRYVLEASSDLSAPWQALTLVPSVSTHADQTQTLCFAHVDNAFGGASAGFLRLKIMLDADLDGTAEATAVSQTQGWARRNFAVGRQTLSMPLLLPSVYAGRVTAVAGRAVTIDTQEADIRTALQAESAHYVEVLDGALAGRIFDIEADASTGSTLMLTAAADAAMKGARICIRPHRTLGALLPAGLLHAAATAEEADRVLFFDSMTGSFEVLWLRAEETGAKWVAGDAATDATTRVIGPQEGMFVQLRVTPAAFTFTGEARSMPLVLPVGKGTRLLGSGLALPQAPAVQNLPSGTSLRLWSGDTDPSTATYQNYQLTPSAQWTDEATGLDVTGQPLLDAFRAFFLVHP